MAAYGGEFAPNTLLLGRARAVDAAPSPLHVLVLKLPEAAFEDISEFDWHEPPKPSVVARACASLWLAGVRLAQIAALLRLEVGVSVVQRYIAATECTPYVLEMLDRGALTWGHVRSLQPLDAPDQRRWAERVVARRLSVRALQDALEEKSEHAASADHAHYEEMLGQALRSDGVRLVPRGSGYDLEIQWAWVPALQGVLQRLGSAPEFAREHELPVVSRTLRLEALSDLELDAVAGHLLSEF